jgi:ribosomal protein S18 acetylase RimI-like enzyme
MDHLFADLELSRRLEGAEALSNSRFVDARARLAPDCGATWVEIAGARAMFDGPASPMTQTFGLGMFQPATAADLEAIEAFYADRVSPVLHEVSPLADPELPALLSERGYRPFEFSSVLYQSIARLKPRATADANVADEEVAQHFTLPQPVVRLIERGEEELYARTSAAGWAEFGVSDFVLEIGRVSGEVEGLRLFLAELDGKPIAAGALALCDGVAHLAGASTMPDGRQRGAQLALLDHRLGYAAAHGCDVALMVALPGSSSQRNAERNGFRIAYTRIKWRRT